MLETPLEHPFFLNRHRDAPLLHEREVFLRHLQQQGTSRAAPVEPVRRINPGSSPPANGILDSIKLLHIDMQYV
jgi:hypothetical protein